MSWLNAILGYVKGLTGNPVAPIEGGHVWSMARLDPDDLRARLQAAVMKPEYQPRPYPDNPKELMTHCDGLVGEAASWYGFDVFLPDEIMANTIHKYMQNHPEQWKMVANPSTEYNVAIEAAGQGCILIAAQTNPSGHGHVAVIAPEPNGERSDSWKKTVPLIANVGKNCWYGRRLSQGFLEEPTTYLYLGS